MDQVVGPADPLKESPRVESSRCNGSSAPPLVLALPDERRTGPSESLARRPDDAPVVLALQSDVVIKISFATFRHLAEDRDRVGTANPPGKC